MDFKLKSFDSKKSKFWRKKTENGNCRYKWLNYKFSSKKSKFWLKIEISVKKIELWIKFLKIESRHFSQDPKSNSYYGKRSFCGYNLLGKNDFKKVTCRKFTKSLNSESQIYRKIRKSRLSATPFCKSPFFRKSLISEYHLVKFPQVSFFRKVGFCPSQLYPRSQFYIYF